jgi:hypothetical protein
MTKLTQINKKFVNLDSVLEELREFTNDSTYNRQLRIGVEFALSKISEKVDEIGVQIGVNLDSFRQEPETSLSRGPSIDGLSRLFSNPTFHGEIAATNTTVYYNSSAPSINVSLPSDMQCLTRLDASYVGEDVSGSEVTVSNEDIGTIHYYSGTSNE